MAELKIEQDALRDTVTINGIRYARAVFEDFAAAMPLGRVFRLVSRENNVLTIEYLPDGVTVDRHQTFSQDTPTDSREKGEGEK